MSETQPQPAGHEPNEVKMRVVYCAAIGMVALMVVAYVVVDGLVSAKPPPAAEDSRAGPAAPRVTLNPQQPQQRAQLQAAETQRLSSYGWIDEQAGVAHMPIERAMELLVEQGLPEPTSPPERKAAQEQP